MWRWCHGWEHLCVCLQIPLFSSQTRTLGARVIGALCPHWEALQVPGCFRALLLVSWAGPQQHVSDTSQCIGVLVNIYWLNINWIEYLLIFLVMHSSKYIIQNNDLLPQRHYAKVERGRHGKENEIQANADVHYTRLKIHCCIFKRLKPKGRFVPSRELEEVWQWIPCYKIVTIMYLSHYEVSSGMACVSQSFVTRGAWSL